jgi:hypothetical protein
MSANAVSRFTCQECGGHNLIVTHVWRIQAGANSERWQEWGPLGDNHNWRYEFREKIENDIENEIQGDGFDDFDEYDSAFESREYEVYQAGHDQQNDEFFVNCETCDREIEFGWSKPGRSGLILPVEFSDFAASECWPDPKYFEAWQQRNWPSMENIKEKSDE